MRLYRTAEGKWVRTQAEAGKGGQPIDVEPNKDGIIELLNIHATVDASPAYTLGRSDAERGMTTNPYASPDLRSEWERGHAEAFELGLAPLPSFASISMPRDGKARRKAQRKAA